MRKIPFSPPYISEDEILNVVEVLKSWWITTWPKLIELEEKLSNFLNSEKINCLSSATAWMEVVMRLLWIWEWDEVIVPAYTYTATASSVIHVWAKPIIVDINKENFSISLSEIEKNITPRTKAIIPVDFWGFPVDYDSIRDLLDSKKDLLNTDNELLSKIWRVAIISDCAHSLWAFYKWRRVWSKWISDFCVFSFHAVKNFTTAEWWAVSYNFWNSNESISKKIKLLTLHGQTKDAFTKMNGSWEYDIVFPWYKENMTDIQAAMWLAQLSKYHKLLSLREDIYYQYKIGFENVENQWLLTTPHWTEKDTKWSFHLFPVILSDNLRIFRDDIIKDLSQEWIIANVHFKPLPLLTAYKDLGYKSLSVPNSINTFEREISLPIYPQLSWDDVKYIIKKFEMIIKKYNEQ